MNIAVHASHLCQDREDGNQTYMKNILPRLAQFKKDTYHLYYNTQPHSFLEHPYLKHHIHPEPFAWTQRVFPSILDSDQPDVLFMPIQMLPFRKPKHLPSVVTIHDLAFFYYPETFPIKDRTLHKLYVKEAIYQADSLIAITEATKNDILTRYNVSPDKIHVVYHGIDHERFRPVTDQDQDSITQVKDTYGITKPYILYVGNVQPRKNIQGLIKAYEIFRSHYKDIDCQLVIAGAEAWMVDKSLKQVHNTWENDIIFTGRFKDQELPPLLWGATGFILPSFYEGFGLPVLEAMACGIPTIVADTPALVEVAGDAALAADPHTPKAMAEQLHTLLCQDTLRQDLIQQGYQRAQEFSWDTSAEQTYTILHNTYEYASR